MRIGVIGTGVAGALLLEGLRAAPGIAAIGFERTGAGERDEAGTALNLCPNALKALRLHRPGRHAALRAASRPWRRWTTALADGTPLLDLDLLEVAEEPGACLRWADLYALLRAPAAGATQHGHALEALEEDAAGRLVPVFRAGDALVRHGGFDLLVAADGRYSRLRALAEGAEPAPRFIGLAMSRLLVTDGDGCPFEDYGQWFNGPNRLLAYRLPGGAAYIAGAFPMPPEAPIPPAMQEAGHAARCYLPREGPVAPAVAWMVRRIESGIGGMHWARVQVTPFARAALGGRVLHLGDAAHAMMPTLGQGATQAIEDGVLAAAVLARGEGAIARFAALRDARVDFVRRLSEDATDTMLPGADPVAGTLRKGEPGFLAALRRLYTEVPGPGEI